MRIAQIAPLFEAVPPKLYGGTERVVHWITEALVEQGHDVTLFASGDSQTSAKLVPVWPQALRLSPIADWVATYALLIETVAQRAHEFDVLHFHIDYWPNSVFSRLGVPFVTTLHGRLDLHEFKVVYSKFPKVPIVSISDNQRKPVADLGWAGTVHHGMPINLLTPQPTTDPSYFAFLGRISPEKRVDRAIEIAGGSSISRFARTAACSRGKVVAGTVPERNARGARPEVRRRAPSPEASLRSFREFEKCAIRERREVGHFLF